MRVQARPDCSAAERNFVEPGHTALDDPQAVRHLRSVTAKLLADRDGRRIHEVGSTDLNHCVKLLSFFSERSKEGLHLREHFLQEHDRRNMHGSRERVI